MKFNTQQNNWLAFVSNDSIGIHKHRITFFLRGGEMDGLGYIAPNI